MEPKFQKIISKYDYADPARTGGFLSSAASRL